MSNPSNSGSNQTNWIFSTIGVVLVAAILIFINAIFKDSRRKYDATEYQIHTLSEGTERILAELDGQLREFDDEAEGERARLVIRFFANFDKDVIPPFFIDYAEKVEAKLREFQALSGDRIELEVIDPKPYSEEENTADLNGVFPVRINETTQVYLGLSVSSLSKNVAVPFLNPQNRALLEYEIARAITEATTNKKPTLGIMTAYQMGGSPPQGLSSRGSAPWAFRAQLEQEYTVQEIPMTVDKIDSNIDTLLVIHPAGIEDRTLYAIDQYLLGGGRIIAMLDPYSWHNRQASRSQPQIQGMPPQNEPLTSTLTKLLTAWGVQFESVNVVAERRYVAENRRFRSPVFLGLPAKAISDENASTKQISYLDMSFAGAFYGDGAEGLTKDILVTSSENAGTLSPHVLFDPTMASTAFNNMEASSSPLELVIQLQGKFQTAFKDGPPEDESTTSEGEGAEKEKPAGTSLSESAETGTVVLIADSDMITDENAPQVVARLPNGQDIMSRPPNGNLAMISNLIGALSGNTNLLEVRSRGNDSRPFTEYKRLTEEAQSEQRKEVDELIAKRQTAETKYNEIRRRQEAGEQVDADELEIVRNYKEERTKTNKRIVELNRELRKGIDRLEAGYKWLNIALIPALVILAAIIHLVIRKVSTNAR